MVYVPGPQNEVADAMSRYAYPASSAREDIGFHGSAKARQEVKDLIEEERALERLVGVICRDRKFPGRLCMLVEGEPVGTKVRVITVGKKRRIHRFYSEQISDEYTVTQKWVRNRTLNIRMSCTIGVSVCKCAKSQISPMMGRRG